MNIAILDPLEKVLKFLNPEQVEATIIKEEDQFNKLELVYYPVDEDDYNDSLFLFQNGNKVFINDKKKEDSMFQNNYLFVMNTNIKREYYDKNSITVNCEDVLTELNNTGVIVQGNKNGIYSINDDNLNLWFPPYFVGILAEFEKNTVSITGTINKINLLRNIEEITKCKFITHYELNEANNIERHLVLQDIKEIGTKHKIPIEIGFNSNHMSYEVDETDTFTGMSPIFKVNNKSEEIINFKAIADGWVGLEIKKGQSITYLVDKSGDSVVPYKCKTLFYKEKGLTYIEADGDTLDYPKVYDKEFVPHNKTGTIEISDTKDNKTSLQQYLEIVFSKCADELEKHINQKINLELEVFNNSKVRYDLYDQLIVKVPNLVKIVDAYVSKVEYNPFNPFEAKIDIKTNDFDKQYRETTVLSLKRDGNTLLIRLSCNSSLLKKKVRLLVVKEQETHTITKKVKNKNYKETVSSSTITITAKPSCSYKCGSYKWRTKTWVNKCPFCGHKLSINPKHVPERELTCSHCDADFCGNCGRDKAGGGSRKRLTPASKGKGGTQKKYTKHKEKVVTKGFIKRKTLVTSENSDIKFNFKFKKGKYRVICYFEGDDKYLPCKNSFKFSIKK